MILICFGTRPEWLKIKPLIPKLQCELLFTGQHETLAGEIQFNYKMSQLPSGSRLNSVISNCLSQFPDTKKYSYVLVQGDTATALACALAAFNQGTKVIHLEAGLRTLDLGNPFPEEGYRQMISRISSINLCPTRLSAKNLEKEGISNFHIVGNTSLDNLLPWKSSCSYENKVLVTLHRRENHDNIANWFKKIEELANDYPWLDFILPIHPNPNVIKHRNLLLKVKVVDPLDHSSLLDILSKCSLCITDSGGIQEEASFLNKKIIVCRKSTERPEGIESGHLMLCSEPEKLNIVFDEIIKNTKIDTGCPFGNGNSASLIKRVLESYE
jgi:UDP-N-acetylglucosamine 2-epimerase (non-hydrolysing)